ncbi:MAG: WG repeat-containing protein [Cyanobacteria bacterium SZAS LIN-2]|nr:WG repeat-containing protein [Cyanobacteria bacterium SZAS LIN-2]
MRRIDWGSMLKRYFSKQAICEQGRRIVGALATLFLFATTLAACHRTTHYPPIIPELTFGVINMKGEWIIPPIYYNIIYAEKIDGYWLQHDPNSPEAQIWIPPIFKSFRKNENWTLVDKNGEEMASDLPHDTYLVTGQTSTRAQRITTYSDLIPLRGRNGYGACDQRGKIVIPCKYGAVFEVGDGLWIARESPDDTTVGRLLAKLQPQTPGQPDFYPSYLMDGAGKQIARLPDEFCMPYGRFANGLLACGFANPKACYTKAINNRGEVVPQTDNKYVAACKAAETTAPQSTRFYRVYKIPTSAHAPLTFEDPTESNVADIAFARPTEISRNMAIADIQKGGRYLGGIIDSNGKWLLAPKYECIGYCSNDRLIVSKPR